MKIITVVGARPQFVKAAVVSRALRKKDSITEIIIHTGQHYDSNMSDIFFDEMDIPQPAYNLQINESLHGAMTGKMLEGLEQIFIKEKPDAILVYGDTNSTLAATLAASKLHILVAHAEAGLRSFNLKMPEEVNRIVTDRLSSLLFCPTDQAMENLEKEGFRNFKCRIYRTGDVMLDAAIYYKEHSSSTVLKQLGLQTDQYYLCTIHRPENTNDIKRLSSIVNALNELHKELQVIVPLHPRTVKYLEQYNITSAFRIIEPVGYFDMLQLIANCKLVLTDSGGLQKEAFFFKKFCVTLRDQTEWVELVQHNCNTLTGADKDKILDAVLNFSAMPFKENLILYGTGNAGENIADLLETCIFTNT